MNHQYQEWCRQGRIIGPAKGESWWSSHAQCVTPLVLEPRRWRLYFGARDKHGQSHIVFVDVDPMADMRVLDEHIEPVLELGVRGTFDSAGQGPCMALVRDRRIELYYVGIHLRRDVPYGLGIGLAQSDDGVRFQRATPGPVLSTGPDDPYFVSVPWVEDLGGQSSAWYMSGVGWAPVKNGPPDPLYDLKQAKSNDGIHWETSSQGGVVLGENDGGLARPWVVKTTDGNILHYSQRGTMGFREDDESAYRLMSVKLNENGAPEGSPEPLRFKNPAKPDHWDYHMQAYSCILPLDGGWVMFYNGNDFGRCGFGWATLGFK